MGDFFRKEKLQEVLGIKEEERVVKKAVIKKEQKLVVKKAGIKRKQRAKKEVFVEEEQAVVLNKRPEKKFEEVVVEGVLSVLTVYCAKIYGQRSHERREKRENKKRASIGVSDSNKE